MKSKSKIVLHKGFIEMTIFSIYRNQEIQYLSYTETRKQEIIKQSQE